MSDGENASYVLDPFAGVRNRQTVPTNEPKPGDTRTVELGYGRVGIQEYVPAEYGWSMGKKVEIVPGYWHTVSNFDATTGGGAGRYWLPGELELEQAKLEQAREQARWASGANIYGSQMQGKASLATTMAGMAGQAAEFAANPREPYAYLTYMNAMPGLTPAQGASANPAAFGQYQTGLQGAFQRMFGPTSEKLSQAWGAAENPPSMAGGGKMTVNEPSGVIGLRTGRLYATLAEKQPETVSVSKVPSFQEGGTFGVNPGGAGYNAEEYSSELAKQLRALGMNWEYKPGGPYSPPPGQMTSQLWRAMQTRPSLYQMVQASASASGLPDWEAEAKSFIPKAPSYGISYRGW